jgi:hypothetical protein
MNAFFPILATLSAPEIFGPVPEKTPSWYESGEAVVFFFAALVLLVLATALLLYRRKVKKRAAVAALPVNIARRSLAGLAGKDADGNFVRSLSAILRGAVASASGLNAGSLSAGGIEAALAGGACAGKAAETLALLRRCDAILFAGKAENSGTLLEDAGRAVEALFADDTKGGAA